VFEVNGDGKIVDYLGGYEDYLATCVLAGGDN
jgi:hypothetical protein